MDSRIAIVHENGRDAEPFRAPTRLALGVIDRGVLRGVVRLVVDADEPAAVRTREYVDGRCVG
jgi:hypothetical protein